MNHTKTNAELAATINQYWRQPVARVAHKTELLPGGGRMTYEAVVSTMVNGLPPGAVSLPAGR